MIYNLGFKIILPEISEVSTFCFYSLYKYIFMYMKYSLFEGKM